MVVADLVSGKAFEGNAKGTTWEMLLLVDKKSILEASPVVTASLWS